jgi:hypothetical protein
MGTYIQDGETEGPPAKNKTRCNLTHTAQSKARQRQAKSNKTTQHPHTSHKTGLNHLSSVEGQQDRVSGSGQRLASRHTRPTDTWTRCPSKRLR